MVLITSIPNELVTSYGATNAATAIGATGSYDGQKYHQFGGAGQGYRCSVWVWDDTGASWQCMPITPIQGTGDPNGSVTPDNIGQNFLATDTGNLYIATGLTSSDWTLTN